MNRASQKRIVSDKFQFVKMNGSTPEARKSLFVKQASFGGLSPAAPESEGGAVGGLSDTKSGVRGVHDVGREENIGEGRNLFTEGIFSLSCRGEVEKVRSEKIVLKTPVIGVIKLKQVGS